MNSNEPADVEGGKLSTCIPFRHLRFTPFGPQDMQKRMASTFGSIAESQVTVDTTITSIISEVQESTLGNGTVFGESQDVNLSPME